MAAAIFAEDVVRYKTPALSHLCAECAREEAAAVDGARGGSRGAAGRRRRPRPAGTEGGERRESGARRSILMLCKINRLG